MAIKKKYFILILLVAQFMVFCSFCSTCYALTPINEFTYAEFSSTLDVIHDNLAYSAVSSTAKNYFNGFYSNTSKRLEAFSRLLGLLNTHVDYVEQVFFCYGMNGIICFTVNNNTIGDNLPFIGLYGSDIMIFYDDKLATTSGYTVYLTPSSPSGNYNIAGENASAINLSTNNYPYLDNGKLTWYLWGCFHYPCSIYNNYRSPKGWTFLNNSNVINPLNQPDNPSENPSGDSSGDSSGDITSGTITNPSGEVTGNIDLSGIENSLNNIESKIPTSGEIGNILSGETGKIIGTLTDNPDLSNTNITSGDITDALDFEFASDPYANFWLELTNGLKNALLGTKRTIDITFQSRTWTINLDDFAVLPAWLVIIITPFSTVFFVWILVRWWKVILDKITSGNVDSILKENSEERNFKFVLGGMFI